MIVQTSSEDFSLDNLPPVLEQIEKIQSLVDEAYQIRKLDPSAAMRLSLEVYAQSTSGNFLENPYMKGIAQSYLSQARVHAIRGDYESALPLLESGLAIFEQLDDYEHSHTCMNILGLVYNHIGDYPSALVMHQQALEFSRRHGLLFQQESSLANIGAIHSKLGDHKRALASYQRVRQFAQENQRLDAQCIATLDCSRSLYEQGLYLEALADAKEALSLSESIQDPMVMVGAKAMIGLISSRLGQHERCVEYLNEAIEMANQHGFENQETEILVHLASHLIRINQNPEMMQKAHRLLKRALLLAEKLGMYDLQFKCHEKLARVCEYQGAYKEALLHYRNFHFIKESIFNKQSDTTLKNLEIRFKTRQIQAEAERQKSLREEDSRYFKRLNEMKNALISTASHDLKTPLASMKILLSLLEYHGRIDDTRGLDLMSQLDLSVNRMQKLIENLLDLARIESGRLIELNPVPINEVVERVAKSMANMAQEKQIQILMEADTPYIISGESLYLEQVFENLISNAIKYSPSNRQISIRIKDEVFAVRVDISDEGYGISEEDLPHIFESFFRANHGSTVRREVDGTGLGLTIVQSIVAQHGGSIHVKSEVGEGSTFSLTFNKWFDLNQLAEEA